MNLKPTHYTAESVTDRIERFQSLSAGQYWRSKDAISSQGISGGEVLLITSIRWVDDKPHTVILRSHPNKMGQSYEATRKDENGREYRQYLDYGEHSFLMDDFLKSFHFEPQAEQIRATELKQVQQKVADLQTELVTVQADPERMRLIVDAGLREADEKAAEEAAKKGDDQRPPTQLPLAAADVEHVASLATGTVVNAIGAGLTEAGIEQMKQAASHQHRIATVKANWIQSMTGQISETITAMTPFFEEKAAAALALTEETRTYVAKLMQGIESLDLFVGKGVEVTTLRTGASAPPDEPLTIMQRKLLMDEELAVWADVSEKFDFSKEQVFFDALVKHPEFVDQIFPTQRCLLVMAVTRRHIDYGDAWVNLAKNQENRKVFLLVRDGENLHRVFSPVESHLGASRLFPAKGDDEKIFRGMNGREIKFDDVAFTDRLKAHEAHALHYRRFLLLCCGLDHRLKLFGQFYPGEPSFEFMSLAFQEEYLRFAHDDADSGRLLGELRPPVMKWIQEKNKHLGSGSRVLCFWRELMTPSTAPSACQESTSRHHEFYLRYRPKNALDVAIVYRDGADLCVDIEVSGETVRLKDRTFTCKVNLSKFRDGRWEYTEQAFLCLDTVSLEDVRWYIHNRESRSRHLEYIRFFKRALAHLETEHAEEAGARTALASALEEGRIASGTKAAELIDQAVVAWRASNRGKALPKFTGSISPEWRSLLDQLYMLASEGAHQIEEVGTFVRGLGYAPLRLVLSGGAKLQVYAAPAVNERDDRLTPHFWVHMITLERGKRGLKEKARRWVLLPKKSASETTLHEWEGYEEWVFENVTITLERKRKMLATASEYRAQIEAFVNPSDEVHRTRVSEWLDVRAEMMLDSNYVQHPFVAVPIGVVYYPRAKEIRYLCVGTSNVHGLLHRATSDVAVRQKLRREFASVYGVESQGEERYDKDVEITNLWSLFEVTESTIDRRHGAYLLKTGYQRVSGWSLCDPRLSQWLAIFIEDNKKHAKMWFAPGIYDADGRCQLDALLKNPIPADFEPTHIQEVTLMANDGQVLPKYTKWYDIKTLSDGDQSRVTIDRRDQPNGVGDFGFCINHHFEASRAAARAFIERQDEGAIRHVPVSEVPDAPPAPPGVERWYQMPVEESRA